MHPFTLPFAHARLTTAASLLKMLFVECHASLGEHPETCCKCNQHSLLCWPSSVQLVEVPRQLQLQRQRLLRCFCLGHVGGCSAAAAVLLGGRRHAGACRANITQLGYGDLHACVTQLVHGDACRGAALERHGKPDVQAAAHVATPAAEDQMVVNIKWLRCSAADVSFLGHGLYPRLSCRFGRRAAACAPRAARCTHFLWRCRGPAAKQDSGHGGILHLALPQPSTSWVGSASVTHLPTNILWPAPSLSCATSSFSFTCKRMHDSCESRVRLCHAL